MAIILTTSIFIHLPKCGGTWVREALQNANLIKNKTPGSTKHSSLAELRPKFPEMIMGKKPFTFVRNAVTWWQSRWSDPYHRENYFKRPIPNSEKWCPNIRWFNAETMIRNDEQFDDFNKYIAYMLEWRPGFYTEYCRFMTNVKKIEIGKYERLTDDLIEILYRLGENFDAKTIRETEIANESDPEVKNKRYYTYENLKKLIEAEKKILEQYGYSTNTDDYIHLVR
jgi:hypothetical protein